ncbi:glycosyltransferase [Entomospira entomophila]|uniref:Glycosyltransferase family 8 protein n=1 Tax=Entomospira entomophila TaxID=2719988 RepID=A0A968KQW6_9SPIO|nr:glycosyltransferase [Entomospira entomophilus]NIZ40199.1 hypothetical protein [Entomospira entomophilus]WDI35758.1 glycosyltransferase [Entomospira entomophilus]
MKVPIVFAIDDRYINQIRVTLLSLFEHADTSTVYLVYILNYQLTDSSRRILETFVRLHHPGGELNFLDVTEEQYMAIPQVGSWGAQASFRLLLPNLLPTLDKVIYLDADILILGDLSTLYAIDLGNTAFAAVPENVLPYRCAMIMQHLAEIDGLPSQYEMEWLYINSGSLLMNLRMMRDIDIAGIAIRLLTGMPSTGYWAEEFVPSDTHGEIMPDQDILFYIAYHYTTGITYLPIFYNYLVFVFENAKKVNTNSTDYHRFVQFSNRRAISFNGMAEEPVIIHFASMHPWKLLHIKAPYAEIYHHYARQIQWNTTKWASLFFFAKVQNYIRHRLILPDFKRQVERIMKRV